MPTINQIIAFTFLLLLFYSCNGQSKTNETCRKKFKTARDLAYTSFTRQSALDSALHLANECIQCDSIRKEVVDFKITLLVSMRKYAEGIAFVDSLRESDFTFGYKQSFISKGLQALEYNSKGDTAKRNIIYKEIANDIKHYIKKRNISDKEFKEIYTDLFTLKENYLDANQINIAVEALKKRYPEKKAFFEFFKR